MKSDGYSLSTLVDKFNSKRVVFCGSDEIALPMLEYLNQLQAISLTGVLTQPDRRSGRGRKLKANSIKEWASQNSVEIRTPEKPTRNEIEWLKEIDADLVLVMAYGHILSQEFLDCTPWGCFNLHASLLPKYRGASPIETALANGDFETGVTLMRMVRKMDAGPLVGQEVVQITSEDTGTSLRKKLADSCVPLIQKYLNELLSGTATELPQMENEVTYCRKLKKEDAHLNFSLGAKFLECRVRAFKAWPGSIFIYDETPLKIGSAKALPDQGLSPGQIEVKSNDIRVGTGEGILQIFELQKPGGKMLPVADFIRGFTFDNNVQVKFAENQPLVSKNFH